MPLPAILAVIQGIIAAAPKILDAYNAAKAFINGLFGAGLITSDQQAQLHSQVDAVVTAILSGNPPPEWTVEPDPGTAPAPQPTTISIIPAVTA
jgi:hypothetical protein